MGKRDPKEVFLTNLKNKINGLLINNPNYTNSYYSTNPRADLLEDTRERALYIIEEIERTKHLL